MVFPVLIKYTSVYEAVSLFLIICVTLFAVARSRVGPRKEGKLLGKRLDCIIR